MEERTPRTPEEIEEGKRERLEKARKKERNSLFGMIVVVLGILMLVVPILITQTIALIPAVVGFGVVIVGGIFTDPEHFVGIAKSALDALPGGKH